MCSLLAFFPGKRRLTNGMLSDLRAAGVYAGQAKARGWKLKPGFDAFAAETATIRQMVALRFRRAACEALIRGFGGWGKLIVTVWVVGHRKHDPDAWLLLGKAAVDGLVDARAVRRDRDGVLLGGAVSRERGEQCPDLEWLGCDDAGEVGFWLVVQSLRCHCQTVGTLTGGV